MTLVEKLAKFVVNASWKSLSQEAQAALKIRVLDSLGCAIGALNGVPVRYIRKHIDEFGGSEMCTMIGGGKTAPDRAAFYNSALVRYLDFNDSYLSKGETCHPSDNLVSVLAAAEYANCSGREFLTGLAVALQVQWGYLKVIKVLWTPSQADLLLTGPLKIWKVLIVRL